MINKEEVDRFDSIKEVADFGQWDVNLKHGWMPQTQHSSEIFDQDGLSVKICWQKKKIAAQASIMYFRITLKGEQLRAPLSFMLEADDCFRLFYLLNDIQSNGVELVDTQVRKSHYRNYIRKDTLSLLREATLYPDKLDNILEQTKRWGQQEEQYADNCTAAYGEQVNPVVLFLVNGREKKSKKEIIDHRFTVSHTPMRKPGVPKAEPFRIQIQEPRDQRNCKMKRVHVNLTQEQFSAFVGAMWEAYKQWWSQE